MGSTLVPGPRTSEGAQLVAPAESACDAFGRARSGGQLSLFENKQLYAKDTRFLVEALVGTGASAFVANQASVRLTVSANGDKVTRQTKQYMPYSPGQSQLIEATGILSETADANVEQRIGYFDDNNGYYFQAVNGALSVVRRTNTSGSPVNNSVAQASWNLDKLDGTGPSGVTLDPTKGNVFVIDFAWLGVGGARLGILWKNRILYCHEFNNENTLATVHLETPVLPVRWEIEAVGVPGGATDMRQICCAVFSEGTQQTLGLVLTKDLGTAGRAVNTSGVPVISIRAKSGRPRVALLPKRVSVLPFGGAADLIVQVVIGGALTGATFADTTTSENADVDVAATAISGGTAVYTGHTSASNQAPGQLEATVNSLLKAAADIAGTTRDAVSLVVTAQTGTPTVLASMDWEEQY